MRKLTLSQAIRKGAAKAPPTTGDYFYEGGACALGSAILGLGLLPNAQREYDKKMIKAADAMRERYAELFDRKVKCPESKLHGARNVWLMIVHLNDTHTWTREAIADWVEKVEAANV